MAKKKKEKENEKRETAQDGGLRKERVTDSTDRTGRPGWMGIGGAACICNFAGRTPPNQSEHQPAKKD